MKDLIYKLQCMIMIMPSDLMSASIHKLISMFQTQNKHLLQLK